MNEFKVGDKVYADDSCYGTIVDINGCIVFVEFETERGGGTVGFNRRYVRRAKWVRLKLKHVK